MSDTLNLETLTLRLRRFPDTQQSDLIAWDAADELLMLNALPDLKGQLLIINDHFGALGCAAARLDPIWINDSFVAHQALKQNLDLNALPQPGRCLADLEPFEDRVDQVWIKLPRNLRYLEYLLDWLNAHLAEGTQVVIAARLKEMPTTLKEITEGYLDEIQPSRIRKKARLLIGKTSGRRAQSPLLLKWQAQGTDFQLENHPNTFAGQKLDVAAHLMLQHIPTGHRRIIDLGCGNGILSLAAAKAEAVSPPAVENASGKFDAPNTTTGPMALCVRRRSGRGRGVRSGRAPSLRISRYPVSSIKSANMRS